MKSGSFKVFEDIFTEAKEIEIKSTIKIGEAINHDSETQDIIAYRPTWVGHACWCSDQQLRQISDANIPVEICITSDSVSMELLTTYNMLNVANLQKLGVTTIPCCDSTMIFNTNIVSELFEYVKLLKLTATELKERMAASVEAIFDETQKDRLREVYAKFNTD